jgi:diguanylate cyclase (GGDEF)-like protein
MILDAGTFMMSLSLDALLCAALSAALTRALPSKSESLWHWSGAMACYAVSLVLFNVSAMGSARNPVLVHFLPHAFAVAGSMSLLSACLSLNGRRSPRWSAPAALAIILFLALSLNYPAAEQTRNAFVLFSCSGYALASSYAFASERRWREGFSGWLAILSTLALAICAAALALLLTTTQISREGFAPFLLFFEASFLSSSFAFILAAGELTHARALELSMRDGLTGLLTRRAFLEAITPALSGAKRLQSTCAMVMVDIDFFKRINDTHGHLAGDAAIAHASALIARSLRGSDICARFGGEEFCALLPDTDEQGALQVAMRILDSARKEPAAYIDPRSGLALSIPYTVSVGVHWQAIDQSSDAQSLLAKADAALYASKASGRDKVTMSHEHPKHLVSAKSHSLA